MTTSKPLPPPLPQDDDWDDKDEWRHPPVAPVDAGIAESFGKAVSDVVTGPDGKAKPAGGAAKNTKP